MQGEGGPNVAKKGAMYMTLPSTTSVKKRRIESQLKVPSGPSYSVLLLCVNLISYSLDLRVRHISVVRYFGPSDPSLLELIIHHDAGQEYESGNLFT